MNIIAICGHFLTEGDNYNGQTVKTTLITKELENHFSRDKVFKIDTQTVKKKPVKFFYNCIKALFNSKNIIILPAQSAVHILVPFFGLLNKFFNRRLHYYVVGGWLKEAIVKDKRLLGYLKQFNGIYVELDSMKKDLEEIGLRNIILVNKFANTIFIAKEEVIEYETLPYPLCFYSRILKQKGIEDAINAVININEKVQKTVFTLDIFGPIDKERYGKEFEKLKASFPDYINYKGVIEYGKATPILKNYFAMLFPTYYSGEGYANAVVDAFAAGLPVIATDWKYNSEIIRNGFDGILYDRDDYDALTNILEKVYKEPRIINEMKTNVCERSKEYIPSNAIVPLINNLG